MNNFDRATRRLIAEAVRLAEAERRRSAPMVAVVKERDEESGLTALKEILQEVIAEAGIVPDMGSKGEQAVQSRKKPVTVDERMAVMLLEDAGRVEWPASKWATTLGCTASMVKQTPTWKKIMKARALLKAGRAERDADRADPDKRRRKR